MKKLSLFLIIMLSIASLSGCVVVPADPVVYGPTYVSPNVYVRPWGCCYYSYPYYGGYYHHWHH